MKCPHSYFLAEALKKNFWTQTIFEKGRVSITQKTLWFHPSCREHTYAHTLSLMHPHPHPHPHTYFFLTLSFFVSFVWTGTHSQWHTHYVPISHTPAHPHAHTHMHARRETLLSSSKWLSNLRTNWIFCGLENMKKRIKLLKKFAADKSSERKRKIGENWCIIYSIVDTEKLKQ